MSKLKDYPVGSIVIYEKTSLVIVAQKDNKPSCAGCYFSDPIQEKRNKKMACYIHGMACTAFIRKDNKHVIFKEQ